MSTTPFACWAISAVQPEHVVRKFEEADHTIASIQAELDASCNAEELRQARADLTALRARCDRELAAEANRINTLKERLLAESTNLDEEQKRAIAARADAINWQRAAEFAQQGNRELIAESDQLRADLAKLKGEQNG
jgi:DNA gyrase/topoisomerase IV subunit A